MPGTAIDDKKISLLGDIPDMLPISREGFAPWNVHVIRRSPGGCKNYISPNRRDFYKIMYVTSGTGVFTMGTRTYHINEPTILFIHPTEIISWKKLDQESVGFICFFKKKFVSRYPSLLSLIEKYGLFNDVLKSVIRLNDPDIKSLNALFEQLFEAGNMVGDMADDTMQAYLQLLMLNCSRLSNFPQPDAISGDFRHIHEFFHLLEKEVGQINYVNPIRLRTAQEFANELAMHPNHLNALLKRHTGQNVSAHIKGRLLEQSKVFLLQTDWSLQDIAYAVGFAEQSNFSQFFKKNSGTTPIEFRRTQSI